MNVFIRFASATALFLACGAALAEGLKVTEVTGSALIWRGGQTQPVEVGSMVGVGDRLTTDVGGRASLALPAGNLMYLGGGGDLLLRELKTGVLNQGGITRLQLRYGSLRVNGNAVGKQPLEDVYVELADTKLRIYGAEAWMDVNDQRRSVCAIAGVVDPETPSGRERLEKPGQCVVVGAGGRHVVTQIGAPPPPSKQAAAMRSTIAPKPGDAPAAVAGAKPGVAPAASAAAPAATGGEWTLVVMSLEDGESAKLEAQALAERGLPARARNTEANGKKLHRVTVGSFSTRAEAAAYADQIQRSSGMIGLWIAHYP